MPTPITAPQTTELILSRRHLRVKVVQAYYAFWQRKAISPDEADRELTESINRLHDSLLYYLYFCVELTHFALQYADEQDSKPGNIIEGIKASRTFINNPMAVAIHEMPGLHNHLRKRGMLSGSVFDIMRALYREVIALPIVQEHAGTEYTAETAAKVYLAIFRHLDMLPVVPAPEPGEPEPSLPSTASTLFDSHMEELNLSWPSDRALVVDNAARIIKKYQQTGNINQLPMSVNGTEVMEFARNLLAQCILLRDELQRMIDDNTPKWDEERIAVTDIVILQVGLAEALSFAEIPLKVTFNEYIDIAKRYSTPKSGPFVNGVMDKIIKLLKESGRIVKSEAGNRTK